MSQVRSTSVQDVVKRILDNVGQVMVGKRPHIEFCLVALLANGHILIEDVPGIGKTTLAKSIARTLGCTIRRVQCTPDLMPSDITGVNYFNQRSGEFEFRTGPIFTQLLLCDEINRATPRTQAALLEAMQERQVTVDGMTMPLPSPFLVMATQNPVELEGTFPLPEAQLDRFLIRIRLGYPDSVDEHEMLTRFEKGDILPTLESVTNPDELLDLQSQVTSVRVDDSLREYIVSVVSGTRNHPSVELGASPRASLALLRSSQALAAVRGRDYVTPDDIKDLCPSVLAHRIILTSQSRLRGRGDDEVIGEILTNTPVPVDSRIP